MNWEQISGQWHQIAGQVKSQWGKLTDDDVANVAGKKEQLVGKVQERYGILKAEAEAQVNAWIDKFLSHHDKAAPTSTNEVSTGSASSAKGSTQGNNIAHNKPAP